MRARAAELRALAERFGITSLRYASPGRLEGRVQADKDALDVVEFDIAASELLGAEVELFSGAVLGKPNLSPDLLTTRLRGSRQS